MDADLLLVIPNVFNDAHTAHLAAGGVQATLHVLHTFHLHGLCDVVALADDLLGAVVHDHCLSFHEVLAVPEASAVLGQHAAALLLHHAVWAVAALAAHGRTELGADRASLDHVVQTRGRVDGAAGLVHLGGLALDGLTGGDLGPPALSLDVHVALAVLEHGLGEVTDAVSQVVLLVTSVHHAGESEFFKSLALSMSPHALSKWMILCGAEQLLAFL